MGDAFWAVATGAPVLVLVLVLQIVFTVTTKAKQVLRVGALVTDRSAPVHGPVAFGLACGAHLAVHQGVAWNDLAGTGFPKPVLRANLAETWGVHDHDDWRRVTEATLSERTGNPEHVAVDLLGPYALALGVGALRAVAHREAVDELFYGRSTKRARALLSEDAESPEAARATVPRALRALLGGDAEVPAPGIALVEEASRRTRVGPELWGTRWRLRAAQRLLHDAGSPLRVPLNGGFGLAGAR